MNIIGYERVSTRMQGDSGLGLEAQRKAIEDYASRSGGIVLKIYTEVESGKIASRPELQKALAHARRAKATLTVAKLDRLARNVAFLSALMDSTVPFVACDNQHANRLTLHILAACAEAEATAISQRTKDALAAYKAKGGLLGSAREGHWLGREDRRLAGGVKGRARASEVISQRAAEAYQDILPMVREMREAGSTLVDIAKRLNSDGQTTRRGRQWSPTQVARVMEM